jgi:hypothetical protein
LQLRLILNCEFLVGGLDPLVRGVWEGGDIHDTLFDNHSANESVSLIKRLLQVDAPGGSREAAR